MSTSQILEPTLANSLSKPSSSKLRGNLERHNTMLAPQSKKIVLQPLEMDSQPQKSAVETPSRAAIKRGQTAVFQKSVKMQITRNLSTSIKDQAVDFKQQVKEQRKKLLSEKPKKQQLYWIYALILNQRRLVYSTCNVLLYYLRCYNCRKKSSLKKNKSSKKEYFLNQGIKKLNQDLDIVSMLDLLNGAKVMRYLILTREDQFLLKNQRAKVIDSSEDSNDHSMQKVCGRKEAQLYDLEAQYKNINKIFTQDAQYLDESQKIDLRKLLNRYQDKEINMQ